MHPRQCFITSSDKTLFITWTAGRNWLPLSTCLSITVSLPVITLHCYYTLLPAILPSYMKTALLLSPMQPWITMPNLLPCRDDSMEANNTGRHAYRHLTHTCPVTIQPPVSQEPTHIHLSQLRIGYMREKQAQLRTAIYKCICQNPN